MTRLYLMSLPVALVAIVLGRIINQRLKARRFLVYIHCGLIVIGVVLMAQAVGK